MEDKILLTYTYDYRSFFSRIDQSYFYYFYSEFWIIYVRNEIWEPELEKKSTRTFIPSQRMNTSMWRKLHNIQQLISIQWSTYLYSTIAH
jgi:hypothetical protein